MVTRWPLPRRFVVIAAVAIAAVATFAGTWNLATHEKDPQVQHDKEVERTPQQMEDIIKANEYRERADAANLAAGQRMADPAWQRQAAADRKARDRRVNSLRAEKRFNDAIDNYLYKTDPDAAPKTVSGLLEAIREPYEAMGKHPR